MRNYNTMLHMKLNSAVSIFAVAAAFSVFLPPSFTSSALAAQPLLQIPPEQRGLLSIELPTDASAARLVGICFLPDCQDDNVMFGDVNMDINEDTEYCEKEGYTYYASGKCPQYQDAVGTCSRDDHYLKCDAEAWCKNNGYNTTSCSIPQYVDEQCPNGKPYYKQCKTDNDRACQELGYTKTCPSGQKLYQNSGRCAYDSSYGTCCTPSGCPSYTSTSYSSYGTNGTDGCEYACYYTCDMDCPSSYPYSSDPTGCSSSSKNGCGNKTCYNSVSCCNSSSSDWCSVHDTCHGDCCSDGTIQSCDSRCGGSGCSSSGSDDNSNNNSGSETCGRLIAYWYYSGSCSYEIAPDGTPYYWLDNIYARYCTTDSSYSYSRQNGRTGFRTLDTCQANIGATFAGPWDLEECGC